MNFSKTLLVLLALLVSGCTAETPFGKCVGLGEEQDPDLNYRMSVKNLVLGIVFFELIAPPIYVLSEQIYCPTGLKKAH